MAAKIFVRERTLVGEGAGQPRFVVVATLGTDLRVLVHHFRRAELEQLAEAAGAEVVYLPRGEYAAEEDAAEAHGGAGRKGMAHGAGRRRQGGAGKPGSGSGRHRNQEED